MRHSRAFFCIVWNDLRQHGRSATGTLWVRWLVRLLALGGFISMHFLVGGLLKVLIEGTRNGGSGILEMMFWAGVAVLTFMAGIQLSLSVLFQRNDLDLMLCSPVPPSVILGARLTSLLLTEMLALGFFVLPVLDALVWYLPHRTAGPHLTWIGITLISVDLGLLLTLLLVRWLGVRRAKTVVQVVGALFGAMMFLFSQTYQYFRQSVSATVDVEVKNHAWSNAASQGFDWLLAVPKGHILPLLGFALVLAAVTYGTIRLSAHAFLSGWQDGHQNSAARRITGRVQFQSGILLSVMRKEWRLIFRQPTVLSSLLLPMVYFMPGMFMAFKTQRVISLPGLGLLSSSMLASSCAVLAAGAEECYDLIRMSPVTSRIILWGKVLAAIAPGVVVSIVVTVCLFIVHKPWAAVAFLYASLLLGLTTAWIQASSARKIELTNVLRRQRGGSWGSSFVMLLHLAGASLGVLPFFSNFWWIGAAWLFVWSWLAVGTMVLWPQSRFESLYRSEVSQRGAQKKS
jgi:ABC-2 type transport system permease protein